MHHLAVRKLRQERADAAAFAAKRDEFKEKSKEREKVNKTRLNNHENIGLFLGKIQNFSFALFELYCDLPIQTTQGNHFEPCF